MRKYLLPALMLCLFSTFECVAQKKDFNYKFYGYIGTDLCYNTRANEEGVDGLFFLFPKDKMEDPNGKDLNGTTYGNFYALCTRLGLDVAGPQLGSAKTSAKVEIDFRGSGSSYYTLRLRHAYLNLEWKKSALLLGQTWHPLFGEVFPQVLNLSTGAPFQPFGRAPQIRYRFTNKNIQLTGAAIWQSQYFSQGPEGKSVNYIKNSGIPEIYIGADYKTDKLQIGAGVELLSLKPRTVATVNNMQFKVNERITTLSYEAHAKYTNKDWFIAAKTVLGSNLTQTSMLGGYGIKSQNEQTGEQSYTPIRVSSSWLNIVHGKKWKPGIFLGYAKNLGTSDTLEMPTLYGTGTNIDQLATAGAELSYNIPHWKLGLEYMLSSAWYGSLNPNGKIVDTHSVRNHRIVAVAAFMF